MAAAIEQNHDERGIVWPAAIAPYDVHVVAIGAADGALAAGERLAGELSAAGLEVLLDDRDRRPGEKFADADLIGRPVRVTSVKRTVEQVSVDVLIRRTGEQRDVLLGEAVEHVRGLL